MAAACSQPRSIHGRLVSPRFTSLQYIDEGAFGMICSAFDNRSSRRVVIKKISPFFNGSNGSKALTEIMILSCFEHDNIVNILDIVAAPTLRDIQDLYIILPLMETDLNKLLKSRHLSGEQVRLVLYQILRGLKYIHSANVIHFDLRPANILVNSDCSVKICDFGLSLIITPTQTQSDKYFYTSARGYRAPETMLGTSFISKAVDIWSVGCILAEMISNRQFITGKNDFDELSSIIKIVGSPSSEDLLSITEEPIKRHIRSLGHKCKVPLYQIFPNAEQVALDLLDRMITFSPSERIAIKDALCHSFLHRYRDEDNEPVASVPLNIQSEVDRLTSREIRKKIYNEAVKYHTTS